MQQEEKIPESKAYNKGDEVPEDGKYVCMPCGYHHEYKAGDIFGECVSCMAGTNDGPDEFVEGYELWEKLEKNNHR